MKAPWLYQLLRYLFTLALNVFYNMIDVKGAENVPVGEATIVFPNHFNSLTDGFIVMSSLDRFVQMTAKDTLFKSAWWGMWLRSAGAIPISRPKDHGGKANNTEAFQALIDALGSGACACLFPEGISRYHSAMAPLKPGVARIAFETVKQYTKKDPNFRVNLLPCGVTYTHREKLRSDIYVEFAKPIRITKDDIPDDGNVTPEMVSALTKDMERILRANVLEAPDWQTIRIAHTARNIRIPLGTEVSLGFTMKASTYFKDVFTTPELVAQAEEELKAMDGKDSVSKLKEDLETYQSSLDKYGFKDNRVRMGPLPIIVLLWRILLRLVLCTVLLALAAPGLLLWSPTILLMRLEEERLRRKGIEQNFDEVTHHKFTIGFLWVIVLASMVATYTLAHSWAYFWWSWFLVPSTMWMALRWFEDAVASARSLLTLFRMVRFGKTPLLDLKAKRDALEPRVRAVTHIKGAPLDVHLPVEEGKWDRGSYFSIRRRRKKDWNEVLRFWDITDFNSSAGSHSKTL